MIIDQFGDGQLLQVIMHGRLFSYWGSNTNIITPSGKSGTNDNLNTDFVQS